jgi:hypothetical protein
MCMMTKRLEHWSFVPRGINHKLETCRKRNVDERKQTQLRNLESKMENSGIGMNGFR